MIETKHVHERLIETERERSIETEHVHERLTVTERERLIETERERMIESERERLRQSEKDRDRARKTETRCTVGLTVVPSAAPVGIGGMSSCSSCGGIGTGCDT